MGERIAREIISDCIHKGDSISLNMLLIGHNTENLCQLSDSRDLPKSTHAMTIIFPTHNKLNKEMKALLLLLTLLILVFGFYPITLKWN